MNRSAVLVPSIFMLALCASCAMAGEAKKDDKKEEKKDEGEVKGLTLVKGLEAHLWADEKQLANPTAICFDDKNRLYVAETMRFRIGGGIDNRAAMFLYFDDIKNTEVSQRVTLYEKYKDRFAKDYFTKYAERVSVLEDTSGKGKCDKTTIFADGFNDPLDGPASGIAYRDGKIHLACIPNVWELPDANGDLVADKKDILFGGFGVRVSISGHDLHGLVWGPDGKLYWSHGDRGFNVKSREGEQFLSPGAGGVMRCNADGSQLELIYRGLRNPEELAFDEFGNLFTVDNNADIGDQSRLVYILEGGNSGWDMGCQMLSYGKFAEFAGLPGRQPNPWMVEGLWKKRHDDQPYWILPPVDNITAGPCGLAYNPGTGLNKDYDHSFFVVDYSAGTNSGVHAFKAEEDNAGFKMKNAHKFVWGIPATDVAFGYDGKIYITDYMGGWHESIRAKGRVITVQDNDELKKPVIAEIKKLFADGFKQRPVEELAGLLKHIDMRVRTRAQWELSSRGKDGFKALSAAASGSDNLLARVHGIWGLGQMAKSESDAAKALVSLLGDKESRVREQAAKTLGDRIGDKSISATAEMGDKLIPLLKDDGARVRCFAAITLGKIHHKAALPALATMLRDNDDKDAYLRHAGMMGLAGCGDAASLQPFITDSSRALRMAVLLALRRNKDAAVAAFLKDADPQIYMETVRAIYDVPITAAMPQLAADLKRHMDTGSQPAQGKMTQLTYLRLLNANARYGTPDNAAILADFAAKSNAPEEFRIAALGMLEKWEQPTDVDPIMGQYRPVVRRDKALIRDAMKNALQTILDNGKDALLAKASMLAASVGLALPEKMLWANLEDGKAVEALRVECLRQLTDKKDAKLNAVIPKLLTDGNEGVRLAALDAFIQLDPAKGIASAKEILDGKPKVADTLTVVTDKTEKEWTDLKMRGPSKSDYADASSGKGAVFTFAKNLGKPHEKAGAKGEELPRLNDGKAAQNSDDLENNSWLEGGDYHIMVDLKKPIEIAMVNTFSWHANNRAPQKFTLWGATSDKPDTGDKNPGNKGWTKIASVDTSGLHEGGKHGSAIFNPSGLGTYRWLMWQCPQKMNATFYTEMDVYEKGQPMPEIGGGSGDQRLKQQSLLSLGKTKDPAAAAVIDAWMDRFSKNDVPPALQLDLLEGAALREEAGIKAKLAQYRGSLNKDDKLAPFKTTLQGGDVAKGRDIFEFHAAQCMKCHRAGDIGSGDAGPNLAGVGKRLTREKILESLIDPSAVIVPGFAVGTFKMADGKLVTGSIFGENEKEVTVKQQDGTVVTLPVGDIKKRVPPTSPMPPMDNVLKPREIRDLIAWLATLETGGAGGDGHH
jgi:quinoprotein glucose dehydrogenase